MIRTIIHAGRSDILRRTLDDSPELLDAWTDRSWMHRAAGTGNLEILEELHSRGATANDAGPEPSFAPLVNAVNHPEVVDWLLERGADASAPGVMVATASFATPEVVQQARMLGRHDIVELIRSASGAFDRLAYLEGCLGSLRPLPETVEFSGAPVQLRLADTGDYTILTTFGLSRSNKYLFGL